jgi:hypothetical protein
MHNIVRTTAAAIVMLAFAGAVRAAAEDESGTLLKGKAAFAHGNRINRASGA